MKQNQKSLTLAAAMAIAGLLAPSAHAQFVTNTICDFNNFALSATYANWDQSGSQAINGGSGYSPIITSGSPGYEINAEGYGSGAYDYPTALNLPGATEVQLTFTLNSTTTSWMGPNFDLSDGTHQVQYLEYGMYTGPGTYVLVAPIGSLDPTDLTAFNLEMDPAGYGNSAPYDITYNNLSVLTPVPEPTTLALLAMGGLGIVAARRRTKSQLN